ncbi:hypothetical protein BSKO_13045 [Bryopsis sp. KO-2023]|nr:hypothetical protein BSKO_13045 [Bryopsis sp. KO-2023]
MFRACHGAERCSGKSTQSRQVAQNFPGWRHISIGDLLRSEVKSGSERGKTCERIMNSGGHVPTSIILDVLKADVDRHKSNDKFLLDWSPSLEQILGFEKQICDYAAALWFDVSKDILASRMADRATYSKRADDRQDIVEKRFETFRQVVFPCKKYLESQGKIIIINGEKPIKELFQDVGEIVRHAVRDASAAFPVAGGFFKGSELKGTWRKTTVPRSRSWMRPQLREARQWKVVSCLCGACETDYGHSSVGECTRCQATWIYTAPISFTMLLSLFLVIDTLRGNLLTERCQDVFEAQGFSMHIPLAEISCLNGEPQAEKSQASSRETPSHRLLVVDIVRLWGISL